MNTEKSGLLSSGLTEVVIGAFYSIYKELGYGFLENVYENAMVVALRDAGLDVAQQRPIEVRFRGHVVGDYRADIVVSDKLLVEVKAADALIPTHDAQVLNYLKATRIPLGLLFNFGPRPRFRRLILD